MDAVHYVAAGGMGMWARVLLVCGWLLCRFMSLLDGDDAMVGWVEQWSAEVGAQAERAAELARRVEGLTATACSGDGVVQVTINSAGVLTDLRLDDQGRWWRLSDIADEVMAVLQQAHQSLADQVAGVVEETVGVDSVVGGQVVRGFTGRAGVAGEDGVVGGVGRSGGAGHGW